MSEVSIPTEVLAEFVREQIKLDCDIHMHAPEGVDVDVWEHIDTADVEWVEYADGDLHAAYKSETSLQEKVANATHWQPAEYRNHDADVLINVTWDLDPGTQPVVDIEVVEQ